jgi:hypothetical protein
MFKLETLASYVYVERVVERDPSVLPHIEVTPLVRPILSCDRSALVSFRSTLGSWCRQYFCISYKELAS